MSNTRRRATPKPKAKPSAKDIIAAATPQEYTIAMCLKGDLTTKYEAALAALAQQRKVGPDSLAGGDLTELQATVEQLREQMEQHTLDFVIHALPDPQWQELVDKHPPRENDEGGVHKDDKPFGVDITTFFPELLPISVVEPELDADDWTALLTKKLTNRQIQVLCNLAWNANKDFIPVPFLRAVSRTNPSSGNA